MFLDSRAPRRNRTDAAGVSLFKTSTIDGSCCEDGFDMSPSASSSLRDVKPVCRAARRCAAAPRSHRRHCFRSSTEILRRVLLINGDHDGSIRIFLLLQRLVSRQHLADFSVRCSIA